jgi:phosphodiesterase/alkaline phosphatase D-like protein
MLRKWRHSLTARGFRRTNPARVRRPLLLEILEDRLTPSVSFAAVAAGDATSNDAILWTRAIDSANPHGSVNLTALVSTDVNFSTGKVFAGHTDPNEDFTLKVDATDLESGTQYYYRFLTDDGELSPVGTFKTAPAPTDSVAVHFGFSGDADGQWRPYGSTVDFPSQNFDYFVFVGDTIYETGSAISPAAADPYTNPAQALADYRRKYLEQLQAVNPHGFAGLQSFFASQGNYTLLDNHETGNKQFQSGGAPAGVPYGAGVDASDPQFDVNTTGTYMNKTLGWHVLEQAYSDYEPIRMVTVHAPDDPRSDGTQQLYFAQQWGANSIFFNLDDRSYRDVRLKTPSGADDTGARADNPDRTMLGATELAWFEQSLLDAQAQGIAWKIVAVSSPIDQIGPIGGSFTIHNAAGTYSNVESDGGKSWMGGYRAERNELLKFIADNHIDHVVFLTTDDHQVRINELGYFAVPSDQSSYTCVPGCFQILVGPLGAGGPDAITDHSFANILSIANSFADQQIAAGIDPIGLDPNFPGLQNVYREGDPLADSLRRPVDFYSPDTFNYASLDVDASGRVLTVTIYGINSYAANTFPEPSASNPVHVILSFQIALNPVDVAVSPATAAFDGTTTLSATLTDASSGAPLAGQVVSFQLGDQVVGTATTDDQGIATLSDVSVHGFDPGTYDGVITVRFAGDAADQVAVGSGTLTVGLPGPGVYVFGTELTIVGGADTNDYVLITPVGAATDGSTGVKVVSQIENVSQSAIYEQSFTAVRAYLGEGNDYFRTADSLTIPAFVTAGHVDSPDAAGYDIIQVGSGNNTITVQGHGNAFVRTGAGEDVIALLNDGFDFVEAGGGNDLIVNGVGPRSVDLGGAESIVVDGTAQVQSGYSLRDILSEFVGNLSVSHDLAESVVRARLQVDVPNTNPNDLLFGLGDFDVILKGA